MIPDRTEPYIGEKERNEIRIKLFDNKEGLEEIIDEI